MSTPPPAAQGKRVSGSRPAKSAGDAHGQRLVALDEARIDPLRLADHFDALEPLQHFLPDDAKLQLREPHADAAVDAEAERQMGARARPVDDEFLRPVDRFLVAVA